MRYFLALAVFVAVALLSIYLVSGLESAQVEETITKIKIDGPCSCVALIYVAGAEVVEDSCMWKVQGDTLSVFIRVRKR